MESTDLLNCAVRVKEEHSYASFVKNDENSAHTDQKIDIKLESVSDEEMQIVFERQDVKIKINSSAVKQIYEDSKNHLQIKKDNDDYKTQNVIKREPKAEVKQEFFDYVSEELNLSSDCEYNEDMEIIFECRDVKPKVDLSVVKKNDDESKNFLKNIGDEIKKIIKTETMKMVKEEILGEDAEEWKLNLDSEYDSDMKIVFQCEDVKLKVELPVVKKNDDDSKNSLWNIKKSAGEEIKKITKTETMKKVKEEILGDCAEEWELNLDSENDSDMKIVFQCEDVKLKVELSSLEKIDNRSIDHLRNFKVRDCSKTQDIIETTARVKQEFVGDVKKSNIDKKNKNRRITKKFNDTQCEICGRNFSGKSNLKKHVKVVHHSLVYSCDLCTKTFSLKNNLEAHILRAHGYTSKESSNACETCSQKFLFKSNLNRHYQSIHLRIPHPCDVCGKKFSSKSSLTIHIKAKHKGIKRTCDVCGKKFSTKTNLKTHVDSIHIKHPCDVCGKKFTDKGNLRVHVHSVHSGYNCTCDICQRTFTQKRSLKNHIVVVHGNTHALYPCRTCGKTFLYTSSLGHHENSKHKGVRHKCDTCKKQYRRKDCLRNHIDGLHNGVRYECNICGKNISDRNNFRYHMNRMHR
ncbi:hypothetical protein TKK_0011780 [Trichogramma kaykai]